MQKNEEAYHNLHEQLMSTRFSTVKSYFNNNWHHIRDEWVEGLKNKCTNFLNSTNNRLESINQKFKAVVSRHSGLLEFHEHLQICLSSMRVERDHRAASIFQKRPVNLSDLNSDEQSYFDLCTPFAFKHIKQQLSLISKIQGKFSADSSPGLFLVDTSKGTLNVSTEHCQCDFYMSMKLPCRHIFALRKEMNHPLYSETLCDRRWKKEYYLNSHRIFKSTTINETYDNQDDLTNFATITIDKKQKSNRNVLSQHEKYRKTFGVVQKIATVASETSRETFQDRLKTLQGLLAAWQQGEEVTIIKTANHDPDEIDADHDTWEDQVADQADATCKPDVQHVSKKYPHIKKQQLSF